MLDLFHSAHDLLMTVLFVLTTLYLWLISDALRLVLRHIWSNASQGRSQARSSRHQAVTSVASCSKSRAKQPQQDTLTLEHQKSLDSSFWQTRLAPIMSILLLEAGYSSNIHAQHMKFYERYINDAFGPRPIVPGKPRIWNSYMTDDFSPVEFSWSWDAEKPSIRFSIEAIGHTAGSYLDPQNQVTTLRLVDDLCLHYPHIDRRLFDYFRGHLALPDVSSLKLSDGKPSPSFLGLAFEMSRTGTINMKAYFAPLKSLQMDISAKDTIFDAIRRLPEETYAIHAPALESLSAFTTHDRLVSKLEFIGLAIDCVDPSLSRLKLYVRSQETSFESVKHMLTLGSKKRTPEITHALDQLRQLWDLVFNHLVRGDDMSSLPPTSSGTAGILYNYDISTSSSRPNPKIYLPIRHYSASDMDAVDGLSKFLEARQAQRFLEGYRRVVLRAKELSRCKLESGYQTYLAVGFKKGGDLSLCSYLTPQIYRTM